MKAKEYIEIYKPKIDNGGDLTELIVEITFKLIKEGNDLIRTRKASSNEACIACLREQYFKWVIIRERLQLSQAYNNVFYLSLKYWMPKTSTFPEALRWQH